MLKTIAKLWFLLLGGCVILSLGLDLRLSGGAPFIDIICIAGGIYCLALHAVFVVLDSTGE